MDYIVTFELQRCRQRQLRCDDGIAGVHDSLGFAGGAGGEHNLRDVVRVGLQRIQRHTCPRGVEKIIPPRFFYVGGFPHHNHML